MLGIEADIIQKIEQDFAGDYPFALDMIDDFVSCTSKPVSDRLLRAVVFMANGKIEKLDHAIELANIDFRDVLWQAEYDCGETQLYDFHRSFPELGLTDIKKDV